MWRYLEVILTASILCAAGPSEHLEKLPAVGSPFNPPGGTDSSGICMVSPGQMDTCAKVEVAEVQYTVAFRQKAKVGKPVVTYIHTSDPRFVSPSGKRVGDLLDVSYAEVIAAPGFEIYAGKPVGGWTTVVGFNGKVTSGSGGDESVNLETLRDASGLVRLRITGFAAR